MQEYIVDFQGFQWPSNRFILKEIAVIDLQTNNYVTHLFEPPTNWDLLPVKYKCANLWLTRNFHNLNWNDGYIPYHFLQKVLKQLILGATCIYVKGYEKKKFLTEILDNKYLVIDLTDVNCPALKYLTNDKNVKCPHHLDDDEHSKYHCALKNVQMLKSWISVFSYDE